MDYTGVVCISDKRDIYMDKEYITMEGSLDSASNSLPVAVTDIGCEREINEDRYAGFKVSGGYVWIVCDGMGGAVGGELAAQLALDTIKRSLESHPVDVDIDVLVQAIQEANRVIVLRRQNPVFSGMGTTIVAALVTDDGVFIAHVGDSRAYVVSRNRIEQLMKDHTYVQDLVEKGMITEEEALHHPQSHVLTRCLGAEPRAKIDKSIYSVISNKGSDNELLLLCSDGLYSLVSEDEIHEVLISRSAQEACMHLVEMARDRGGYDNITLAVIPLQGVLTQDLDISTKQGASLGPSISDYDSEDVPRKRNSFSKFQLVMLTIILAFVSLFITVVAFFSFFE